MEINDFIANFVQEFDEVPTEEITATTAFRKLSGWSSIQALVIMMMITEKYNVILTVQEMTDANSIQDLFDLIQKHLSE